MDLLLEIGVEELPSASLPETINELQQLTQLRLDNYRLHYESIKVMSTPRRLTIYIRDLAEQQADAHIENRGPKKEIAFDKEGNPSKAGLGFARGQGIDFEQLEIRQVGDVEYVFACKIEIGNATTDILTELLQGIITSVPFPKSMRWGDFSLRFARPIRWLLALYGSSLITLQIENISSDRYTYGHRFLSRGKLEVRDSQQYFQQLQEHYVILDQDQRRDLIWQQVQKVAVDMNATAMHNPDLLEEITYLVEYPTAFYGSFSPSYLQVPSEVLTTSMIEHQRYFPLYDKENKLMPGFVGVRNGSDYSLEVVRAGNERVLRARLEDALFFWNEDTRQPIEVMTRNLKDVLFQERLGNLQEKVERLAVIARYIGQQLSLGDPDLINRSAALCKADLLSNMVYEFPELQGIMGRYYAQHSGEPAEVCEAIFEHYLPRFSGDNLPTTATGTVLSLAEKVHNLTGCFAIGFKPSGSQDPYALRRQALGMVNIILSQQLELDLKDIFAAAYDCFEMVIPDIDKTTAVNELNDFVLQRLRGILMEHYSYDVVDAVLANPSGNLADLQRRAWAVNQLKQSSYYEDFMVVYNRANNLSRKWEAHSYSAEVLIDDSEKYLYQQIKEVRPRIEQAVEQHNYILAIQQLADLRPALDAFFEAVMVMVDDETLKAARMGMLKQITAYCHFIAQFNKLVQ
ncbi:MAG: glycine--tRNA ligase subunit beta [Syntrophomonadaceae bacterium]|nr:glycine--tRNA ligase subunit beta [Syntrophomonadaceae bacterium]